ncbi:MAG: PEP-utilizing enzyme [Candidatus Methanomethylicia archaeon]|nr:PEP-utilizing enzyme [Candidatus Methanomethylicia archaeon]
MSLQLMHISEMRAGSASSRILESISFLEREGLRVPATIILSATGIGGTAAGTNSTSEITKILGGRLDPERGYKITVIADEEAGLKGNEMGAAPSNHAGRGEIVPRLISQMLGELCASHKIPAGSRAVIIIQETVIPKLAGAAFTKNPVDGSDELIIEATLSQSDSVGKEGAGTMRWVLKKGSWIERTQTNELWVLPVINQVARDAKAIARRIKEPLSLEWAYDGESLVWLRSKQISSIGTVDIYSNKLSKERMPGIVKPLVWSISIPLVNDAWRRLFTDLIGPNSLDSSKFTKLFYYRAYFNMGVVGNVFELLGMPRESLEMIVGESSGRSRPRFKPSPKLLAFLPRVFIFFFQHFLSFRKTEGFLKEQEVRYRPFHPSRIAEMGGEEALTAVKELFRINGEAAYYIIINQLKRGIFTASIKYMMKYNKIHESKLSDALAGGHIEEIDPQKALGALNCEFNRLDQGARDKILEGGYRDLEAHPELMGFRSSVSEFMSKFGHLSDSGNDFSIPHWHEDPDLVLKMIISSSQQRTNVPKTNPLFQIKNAFQRGLAHYLVKKTERAMKIADRVTFTFTYGTSLFRDAFLRLGSILVSKGMLESPDDVFYLYFKELSEAIRSPRHSGTYREKVISRKLEIEQFRNLELPEVIYGDLPLPVASKKYSAKRLKGIATSRGYAEGVARVTRGVADFSRVKEGEIVVIPYSDVAWTPILAKAGAIVSESGGLLSHCSVVAREFGIPAVVGVKDAMSIRDGAKVAVDAYSGVVMMLD